MIRKKIWSWVLLLLCNLMWSMQFICIKLTQDQCGPFFTVWLPMLLSIFLLAPFVFKNYKKQQRSIKDIGIFVQLGLLGAFPAQVLMTFGTQFSTASNGAILTLCLPVLSMVFAFFLLKEKMNTARWLCFLMSVGGAVICSANDLLQFSLGSKYTIGNALIFIALVGNAYYNVGIKKIAERYTETEMVFYTYVVVVIMLSPLVWYFEPEVFSRIPEFTTGVWMGLGILTFFHNFLSMILFFKALKNLDAIQVAVSNYLITFLALPIASIFLQERISALTILGGILVFVSTLMISITDFKNAGKYF